jgi:hypothetical protein
LSFAFSWWENISLIRQTIRETKTGRCARVLRFDWFSTALGFLPAVPFANRSAGFFRSLLELASRNARTVDVQTQSLGVQHQSQRNLNHQ